MLYALYLHCIMWLFLSAEVDSNKNLELLYLLKDKHNWNNLITERWVITRNFLGLGFMQCLWSIFQIRLSNRVVFFQTLTYIFGDMLNSVMAAGKVFEYMDRKPQISTDGKLKPDQLEGRINYCGLNFAYPSNPGKTVLQVRKTVTFRFSLMKSCGHFNTADKGNDQFQILQLYFVIFTVSVFASGF